MRKIIKCIVGCLAVYMIVGVLSKPINYFLDDAMNPKTIEVEQSQKESSFQDWLIETTRTIFTSSENYNNPIMEKYYKNTVNEVLDEAKQIEKYCGDINNIDKEGIKQELKRYGSKKVIEEIEDSIKDEGYSLFK